MSVLGTGVASGVAQTSFQAQEAARKREVERSEPQVRRVRQTLEPRLRSQDEADDVEPSMLSRIEDQTQGQSSQDGSPQSGDEPADTADAGDGPQAAAPGQEQPLYRHLDLRA